MKKILVVRTDNIGDLVCTTPLLTALRRRYPDAWIGVLTNSYSAPALHGHPAIDEVLVYQKVKHLAPGESVLGSYWKRLSMILRLRRMRLDLVLIPAVAGQASALRFARKLGAARVIVNADNGAAHEVEKVFAIAGQLPEPLPGPPPACSVTVEPATRAKMLARLGLSEVSAGRLRIGLHISARKPSQRWPAEQFAGFARDLAGRLDAEFLLFWSPGPEDDPKHPGDDGKAADILARLAGLPVYPVPTAQLDELIAGLSFCDVVVQSDGGAMHLAAALGKPILCFFGQSDAARWHPWGVPHLLLQPEGRDVGALPVETVVDAFLRLRSQALSDRAVS